MVPTGVRAPMGHNCGVVDNAGGRGGGFESGILVIVCEVTSSGASRSMSVKIYNREPVDEAAPLVETFGVVLFFHAAPCLRKPF